MNVDLLLDHDMKTGRFDQNGMKSLLVTTSAKVESREVASKDLS